MPGQKSLNILLATMEPRLYEEEYVFCTFKNSSLTDKLHLNPIGSFCEEEGLTLIITKETAHINGIEATAVFSLISLTIHSSLEAIGLTAAIAAKLASKDISANVVAAYYHDHVFVQKEKAQQAMNALRELQEENRHKD